MCIQTGPCLGPSYAMHSYQDETSAVHLSRRRSCGSGARRVRGAAAQRQPLQRAGLERHVHGGERPGLPPQQGPHQPGMLPGGCALSRVPVALDSGGACGARSAHDARHTKLGCPLVRGCTTRRADGAICGGCCYTIHMMVGGMRAIAARKCEQRAAGLAGSAVRLACMHCQHWQVAGPGGDPDRRPRWRNRTAYVARP